MTITERDVVGMYERCKGSAHAAGVVVTRWTLEVGSTTYGRAWRVFDRDETTGGLSDFLGSNGYLGASRRETYTALHAMARAFELVSR